MTTKLMYRLCYTFDYPPTKIVKAGGEDMDRFYFIFEKLRSGKPKFLTVLSGKKVAIAHLKHYAGETANEVYVLDVVSKTVLASMHS